jgi:hypothetical protein
MGATVRVRVATLAFADTPAPTSASTRFLAGKLIAQLEARMKGVLVQWPLLRDFSDQLSRSGVEACLLLFFG